MSEAQWKETPENQSMLRKKHLQCSAEEPWDGSGKAPDEEQRQGGRKAAGFSSLAWVSPSLVPCCRQGPCRDRELRAAVGAAVPRSGTAGDAHLRGRRGKTCQHRPREGPAPSQDCVLTPCRALHSPARHSCRLCRAGHGEHAGCAGIGQAGIGDPPGDLSCSAAAQRVPTWICPYQATEGCLGPNPSCPFSGAEEAAAGRGC